MIWIVPVLLFLIDDFFVSAQNNYYCFYNHSDPNCISLVQRAWNLTRQQTLSRITSIQSLLGNGLLYLDPHSPYQPLDLAVGCFAEHRFPDDSDCSPCEYCPSFKPLVCALFCPPSEAATSSISIRHTSTPRPRVSSVSPSSTLPFELYSATSVVSLSPLYILLIIASSMVLSFLAAVAFVYIWFCKCCCMQYAVYSVVHKLN